MAGRDEDAVNGNGGDTPRRRQPNGGLAGVLSKGIGEIAHMGVTGWMRNIGNMSAMGLIAVMVWNMSSQLAEITRENRAVDREAASFIYKELQEQRRYDQARADGILKALDEQRRHDQAQTEAILRALRVIEDRSLDNLRMNTAHEDILIKTRGILAQHQKSNREVVKLLAALRAQMLALCLKMGLVPPKVGEGPTLRVPWGGPLEVTAGR
jgi:hypothetical protein